MKTTGIEAGCMVLSFFLAVAKDRILLGVKNMGRRNSINGILSITLRLFDNLVNRRTGVLDQFLHIINYARRFSPVLPIPTHQAKAAFLTMSPTSLTFLTAPSKTPLTSAPTSLTPNPLRQNLHAPPTANTTANALTSLLALILTMPLRVYSIFQSFHLTKVHLRQNSIWV